MRKSLEETRKIVADLKNAQEIAKNSMRVAESRMFVPIKEAIDALSSELSDNETIKFAYRDCRHYDIVIKTKTHIYYISVWCEAFPEAYGFRYSYCLNVESTALYEPLHRRFDEGQESALLNALTFILAKYEAEGFIASLSCDS